MRTRKRGIGIAASWVVISLGSGTARAENAAALRLSYRAPTTCPGAQVFADLVRVDAPSVLLDWSGSQTFDGNDTGSVLESQIGFLGNGQALVEYFECGSLAPTRTKKTVTWSTP